MKRTRDWRRHQRDRTVQRKKRTCPWYVTKYDGTLDKGKAFCSCWMCQSPTKARASFSLETELASYDADYLVSRDAAR